MSKPMQLLIPMSGQGRRFQMAGYTCPKPLVDINGLPMIERVLQSFPRDWPCTFVLAENHRASELPAVLLRLRPTARCIFVPAHREGPGHACRYALDALTNDAPVLVSYCDYGMTWDPAAFERFVVSSACDAALISYRGFHAHYLSPQMYAYSQLRGERVVAVREKACFTDNREQEYASAGGYFFRTVQHLRAALDAQQSLQLHCDGEYYLSLTIEAMLRTQAQSHVRVFEIPHFFQWGTPQDVKRFAAWERIFEAYNRAPPRANVAQVLMPMAGHGSRFADIDAAPKPLIYVGDRPMFVEALASLPQGDRTVLVGLDTFAPELLQQAREHHAGAIELISLTATPCGQALSCKAALPHLDPHQELVVSACDHAIVASKQTWDALRDDRRFDAAIFTMTGYPGVIDNPLSYSYVADHAKADGAREVLAVSVKKPLSESALSDATLVGTFWFRTASVMAQGIAALEQADVRTKGELSLDSIFALLMAAGCRVRAVPLDGFICWGEPEAMAEALYWQEALTHRRLRARGRFALEPR